MLISLGFDHRNTDVAARERFHLTDDRIAAIYADERDAVFTEIAAIATCNRSEIYAWHVGGGTAVSRAAPGLLARRWLPASQASALLRRATVRRGADAARHLFRVASGLESQIIGDGQVIGQVRGAYRRAVSAGTVRSVLHRLFDMALHASKRVQSETALFVGRSSVGSEAASLAARRVGDLATATIVIVGCGKTGERTARHLVKLGARDLVLVNRTADRAAALAAALGMRTASFDDRHRVIAHAHAAIIATGAGSHIVDRAVFADDFTAREERRGPLLLIDLSMPRSVDPLVATMPGVVLVDLDNLHPPAAATVAARQAAVPRAEQIVDEELRAFAGWLADAAARDAIRPLQSVITSVCQREIAYAGGQADASRVADRIAAKLLARPMVALRQAAERGEPLGGMATTLAQLFDAPDARPLRTGTR